MLSGEAYTRKHMHGQTQAHINFNIHAEVQMHMLDHCCQDCLNSAANHASAHRMSGENFGDMRVQGNHSSDNNCKKKILVIDFHAITVILFKVKIMAIPFSWWKLLWSIVQENYDDPIFQGENYYDPTVQHENY